MHSAQLAATINDELRWREAELAVSKVHLQRSINDASLFRYSYRCFAAITYAHFEAFTKRVIAQAMQDIFNSGNPWSKCTSSVQMHLFAAGLRQSLMKLSNADLATKGSSTACLIDSVAAPSLDIILDCGNMNVANFFWAIESIGLDPAKFAFARRDIGHLTTLRHNCAHGEALTLDPTKSNADLARDMYGLQGRIVFLLHSLAVETLDHFKEDAYLQP